METEISKEEAEAIASLKRLAKRWPKSLWLFSAGGGLHVMRLQADGEKAVTPNGGMDPEYIVADIHIMNDGGDW